MINWDTVWFEYFDPLTGVIDVPAGIYHSYQGAITRARLLLESRTASEVEALIHLTDAIWDDLNSKHHAISHFAEGKSPQKRFRDAIGPDSDALVMVNKIGIQSAHINNPQRSEILALIALNGIGEVIDDLEYIASPDYTGLYSRDYAVLDTSAFFIHEILDTVSVAELLWTEERDTDEAAPTLAHAGTKDVATNAKEAAKHRHAPTNKLKNEFIRWFQTHKSSAQFKSRANAALVFHNNLPPERKKLIRDPAQFFTTALRQFEKRHPKGVSH